MDEDGNPGLRDLLFEDLFVSKDGDYYFLDRNGIPTNRPWNYEGPVPTGDIGRLLDLAVEAGRKKGEFHLDYDGVRYRVAVIPSVSQTWFAMRRPLNDVPSIDTFEGVAILKDALLRACGKEGLILATGPTGGGKSTFVGSLLLAAMERYGGNAMCIEAPPELRLEGAYKKGRIFQVGMDEADFHSGLERSLRVRPRFIMIGELRTQAAALTAMQAALTGHTVLTTVHGGTIPHALMNLSIMAAPHGRAEHVWRTLSETISVAALMTRRPGFSEPGTRMMIMSELSNPEGVRTKIREGTIEYIAGDIDLMYNRVNTERAVAAGKAGR